MTLTLATLIIFLAPALLIVAVYFLVRQQISALRRRPPVRLDWTPELSVDRYRPMYRLLADDDIRFLSTQPGATPALVKRLRRQRYQVFRGYLRGLQCDFRQACDALLQLAMHSQTDRGDIIRALFVSQMKFSIGMFRVRCRLLLYRWNMGQESVATLVDLFESLQLELLALAPALDGPSV